MNEARLISLVAALATVCLTALAQILLKHGINVVQSSGPAPWAAMHGMNWGALLKNPAVLTGITIYGGSTLLWLFVLSRLPLSQAYPFVGISIVITTIVGAMMLGERITMHQLIGVVLVFGGVWLVARG